jgi:hypothetical protein
MRWLPVVLAMLGATGAVRAEPRLVAPAPTFDFGAVEPGTRVEHAFRVRNDGDAPAVVEGVDRGCACTVGVVSPRTLAPGEELWVSVGLDTTALAGATAKTVTLRSRGAGSAPLRLVMQGTVLRELVADPAVLYLGEVRRGSDVERSVALRAGRPMPAPVRVSGVTARGPFVVPRVLEGDDGTLRIAVRVAADAPPGRFRDEIVVRATGTGQRLVMPVLGIVQADPAAAQNVVAGVGATIRR